LIASSDRPSLRRTPEIAKVDLYIPRKCSATNRLISASDHAAVQINIAHVDAAGHYNGEFTTFAISGVLRKEGRSDEAINRLSTDSGFLKHTYSF